MSNTPRTDAVLPATPECRLTDHTDADYMNLLNLASTLERELAEAKRISDAMHEELHGHDERREWAERELAEAREQINVLKGGMIDLTVTLDESREYAKNLKGLLQHAREYVALHDEIAFVAAIDEALTRPVMENAVNTARWRHKKRGTFYTEIGLAKVQGALPLHEEDVVMVYRGDDGKLWVRPVMEFHDGRFEVAE